MIKYIDYHAHLSDERYDNILDDVVKDIKNNNTYVIVTGSSDLDNLKTINIAKKYNFMAAVGIHPQDIYNSSLEELEKLIVSEYNIIAGIGECGLDLYWRDDDLDRQIVFLERQIKLAIKYNLPIIIHGRKAYIHAYNLLMKYKGKVRGSFHCYEGDIKLAKLIVDNLGFYIGITGIVTFKNGDNIRKLVENIPLSNILVETDSPYLTPVPFRGKINKSYYVKYVIEEIAKIKNKDIEEVRKIVLENTLKLFDRLNLKKEVLK